MKEKVQFEVTAAPATLSLYNLVLHVVLPVLIVFSVLPVLVSLAVTLQNNTLCRVVENVFCTMCSSGSRQRRNGARLKPCVHGIVVRSNYGKEQEVHSYILPWRQLCRNGELTRFSFSLRN